MDDENSTTPLVSKADQFSSLEVTIEECIGGFGWIQFLHVVLVSFVWTFDSQQTFITIFTDAQPTWHCLPGYSCNSNICLLPKNSWSWNMPRHASIVSEWSHECDSSLIIGLPTSSFYLGTLVGGFLLVSLADSSFGRKNTMLLSCMVMSISGLLTTLSTNIWIYSVLRFISGFGKATMGTCSLVLSSELVGKKYRGLLYCLLVYLFVHESPRWLFIQGRKEDFLKTLKSIAPKRKGNIVTLASVSNISFEQKSETVNMYSSIKMLFERKWAIRRLIAAMVVGFGVGLVYYGLPLVVENLNFSIYLSTVLNALSEFPATLVTYFIIGKAKRRNAIFILTTLCSICSLICVITSSSKWKGVQVAMELVSFFSVCTAFDVLLIYTLELFPTCIRNSGVTIVRQIMVAGGATSPVLVGRGKGLVSYLVFGFTIGICGVFVMWLPETRGDTTCDTLDEEERKESERADELPDNQDVLLA
ncbi:MFS domain-containing protein [Heracleum sosnowskyi]|uniref:MFS domain-containing protein n=1 Tax=Heracleum sosnowskyi TaxID=360622 RepID=A0AAD8IX02_9APIA|nr:MFS domain-containing protein [Heracleum sosnowskyi]KAK1393186.1 MFS domain-containing protein [Heracleum sosnowskyi]